MNTVGRWIGVVSIAGGLLLAACSDDGTSDVVANESGDVPDTSAESPAAESPDHVEPGDDWTCVTESPRGTDGNQALTVELCVSDVDVAVGETVQVSVHAEDPDAEIGALGECAPHELQFGDEEAQCVASASCVVPAEDPLPVAGNLDTTSDHAYGAAGSYTVEVFVLSGSACPHPYGNRVSASVDVTVT